MHAAIAQRYGGELEGEAARAPDAALDRVCHLSQVRVAVGQLGPGVGDPDHGAAVEGEIAEAVGPEVRAVHQPVEGPGPEPVAAAKGVCRHARRLLSRSASGTDSA